MEGSPKIQNLLTKFSNSVWILSYFADFRKWERLMMGLWAFTRTMWIKDRKGFGVEIKVHKKTLKYHKGFDNDIYDFLLKGQSEVPGSNSIPNYSKYKIKIEIGIVIIFF